MHKYEHICDMFDYNLELKFKPCVDYIINFFYQNEAIDNYII